MIELSCDQGGPLAPTFVLRPGEDHGQGAQERNQRIEMDFGEVSRKTTNFNSGNPPGVHARS